MPDQQAIDGEFGANNGHPSHVSFRSGLAANAWLVLRGGPLRSRLKDCEMLQIPTQGLQCSSFLGNILSSLSRT